MATGTDWQGRVGREWADKADALDRLLGPVGEAGIKALGAVDAAQVMDLGCGAGASSLALAALGAKVTGLDISEDLLERAQKRDPGNMVNFVLTDATKFKPTQPFDALYSRCGAMFFDDEMDAWSLLRGQMKPGAAACIVVWREAEENGWARLPLEIASSILGHEATRILPANGPGPFAWARPEHFHTVLEQAGWTDIKWHEVRRDAVMEAGNQASPTARGAEFAMRIGPLASRLRGTDPEMRKELFAVLQQGLQAHVKQGKVRVGTSAWIIQAVA